MCVYEYLYICIYELRKISVPRARTTLLCEIDAAVVSPWELEIFGRLGVCMGAPGAYYGN